jgi:hypothetical protein
VARSHFLLVSLHFIHSCVLFAEFSSSFLIAVRSGRGGRASTGVPSRDSNSGPPYSSPTRYQLSHAAPYWATPHPLIHARRTLTESRRPESRHTQQAGLKIPTPLNACTGVGISTLCVLSCLVSSLLSRQYKLDRRHTGRSEKERQLAAWRGRGQGDGLGAESYNRKKA